MSIVECSATQGAVLGALKRHHVISARELTYHMDLTIDQIQEALDFLTRSRLAYLSNDGGFPKRYKPRLNEEEDPEEEPAWPKDV